MASGVIAKQDEPSVDDRRPSAAVAQAVPPWGGAAVPIPERPQYRWPNGASLAVYVAVGIEEYELGGARVEDILEGPGGERGPLLTNAAWRDYGNRVGGFRLLQRLAHHGIPPTVLLNTDAYDTAPALIRAARAAGAEFVGHGASNSHSVLDFIGEEEREYVRRVADRIRAEEGRGPGGWSSPWLEHTGNSFRVLAEEGFDYTLDLRMDDQPVRLGPESGGLLAVPYALELNDSSTMVARRAGAEEFSRMIVDEFDELLAASSEGPLVMSVVAHTFISGTPFRLRALTRALQHLTVDTDQVWLATAGQIARHHAAMTGD